MQRKPTISPTHKKDIKLIYPQRGITAAVTIHGFETYTRVAGADGRPAKQLVPGCPAMFMPTPENTEEGFVFTHVSDTANNRKVIRELMDAGMVHCDSPIFEDVEAPSEPIVPGQVPTAEALVGKTKAELLAIAESFGLAAKSNMSNRQITDMITRMNQ
jgi:hypothetical protein